MAIIALSCWYLTEITWSGNHLITLAAIPDVYLKSHRRGNVNYQISGYRMSTTDYPVKITLISPQPEDNFWSFGNQFEYSS